MMCWFLPSGVVCSHFVAAGANENATVVTRSRRELIVDSRLKSMHWLSLHLSTVLGIRLPDCLASGSVLLHGERWTIKSW